MSRYEQAWEYKQSGLTSKQTAELMGTTPDRIREYCRRYRIRFMIEQTPIKTNFGTGICKVCGKEFEKKSDNHELCSNDCRYRSHHPLKEKKPKLIKIKQPITCAACGKQFVPKGTSIYCSEECKYETVSCEYCDKPFRRRRFADKKHCSNICAKNSKTKSHQEFYEVFSKIHKGSIVPISKYVGSDHDVTVYCLDCGKTSTRRATVFIDKKRGCQHCKRQISTGEEIVLEWLNANHIHNIRQYKFDGLKDTEQLRYDFGVFNNKQELIALIEYNGRQHYEPVKQFGGIAEFERQQRSDNIKRQYALDNGIQLIEISYKQKEYIEDVLAHALGMPPCVINITKD